MDRLDSGDAFDSVEVEPTHTALLSLHEVAGTYEDLGHVPGFDRTPVGEALTTLAAAPPEEATLGLKLDTLVALARADLPGYEGNETQYEALAMAIGADHGVDAEQVLSDVKAVAQVTAIGDTETGAKLPHHATAFVGEQVCQVNSVTVDGKPAVWIFSEFETDAGFAGVADWVRPDNWPKRGAAMFKGMAPVGGAITPIRGGGHADHWHAVYLEDVQLLDRLKTVLHCDYFMDAGQVAGMTYDLTFSVANQLNVDRGFLLAEDLGPVRRVKALKIVGFTDETWNEVAKLVCPFWTDFVRQAAEGGAKTTPGRPGPRPPEPSPGDPPPGGSVGESWKAWIEFFADATKDYSEMAWDVTGRMVGGSYGAKDLVGDGTAYWSKLAKDWARAWAYGSEMLEAMARDGLVTPRPPGAEDETGSRFPKFDTVTAAGATAAGAGATRAGAARAGSVTPRVETVTIPVDGLTANQTATCSDLSPIEADRPRIPATATKVTVVAIDPPQFGVRVATDVTGFGAGLYTGDVTLDTGQIVPVRLYVSNADGTP